MTTMVRVTHLNGELKEASPDGVTFPPSELSVKLKHFGL
jgi:hypothetical protein